MMNWKKLLVATIACGAVFSFAAPVTTEAAYSLNPEVKTVTPALRNASEIGTLVYNNPELQKLENKDAIVVMSFGTTYKDTRAKTIDATINEIKAAHPNTKVVTAFTSHIIINRIQKKEGIKYPTPEEALAQLKKEGYTRVALATLDVIPGMEYSYKRGVYQEYRKQFKKMTFGTPLMYWMGQEEQADDVTAAMKALSTQFPKLGPTDAVLIMCHGTPQPSNAYYSVMQAKLEAMGINNAFIYTVEGWPNLETVIPKLKAKGFKHVTLMPAMMVAGDHANNDMAGDEPDSHKSILKKEGFTVDAYLHGLGENNAIRGLYVAHANEAWDALQAK